MASSPSRPHSVGRHQRLQQSSFASFNARTTRTVANLNPRRKQDPMDLPDRFKNEEDEQADDGAGVNAADMAFAQHSVYGMLAATKPERNFPERLQDSSGSDDDSKVELRTDATRVISSETRSTNVAKRRMERTERNEALHNRTVAKGYRERLSKHSSNLSRSFVKPAKERLDSQAQDPMTQSQILPPRQQDQSRLPNTFKDDAPILERKLKAMARVARESSHTSEPGSEGGPAARTSSESLREKSAQPLAQVISNIFGLEEPEDVLAEYRCWYLQNVLLEGLMYITQQHICFYSYLQKKTNVILKRGDLEKQGKRSNGYHRYYFILKGHMFSYYKSEAEPYFTMGSVDLRYAISADMSTSSDNTEAGTAFTVTTPDRVYYYRAANPKVAKEWVKVLQKVIFRSHNDGDAVKILLPVKNLLDVESTSVVDFSETVKLRVCTDDDTFAVDEYFFSFFESGKDALGILNSLADSAVDKLSSEDHEAPSRETRSRRGRDSVQVKKQSESSKSMSPLGTDESTESFESMTEIANSSSADDLHLDDMMSASQLLTEDSVFWNATVPKQHSQDSSARRRRDDPEGSSRGSSSDRTRRKVGMHVGQQHRPLVYRQQSGGSNKTVQPSLPDDQADINTSYRLVRGISTPLSHAKTVAGIVRSSGKRMSSYLSSSPKTYIGNWSAAIAGGKRHYVATEGLSPDDSVRDPEEDSDAAEHERRFQEHFGLSASEKLLSVFYCWLHKTVPLYGKIYMGNRHFCFRSLWYGTKTKLVIPYKDIINVQKQRGFRWGYPGMILLIRGHEELFFDFSSFGLRDDAVVTVLRSLEKLQVAAESMILTEQEQQDANDAAAENDILEAARKDEFADEYLQSQRAFPDVAPTVVDDHGVFGIDYKPKKPMRITCLTIGSRGDVQPYIALCKGLQAEGHTCKIATHPEFQNWIEKHGIGFEAVGGDPATLMQMCVKNGMFSVQFFWEAHWKFRSWLDDLLQTAWEACQGAELLIESPSAMCGIHIAEALEIPYFRAFTMPWTRTRAYPHAFAVMNAKWGGSYNYMSYTFMDNLFWRAISGQINAWRVKTLGLRSTSLGKLQQNKVPFLYNFSPSVVVPPLDFSDWVRITGYWFLDEGEAWEPPADLAAFIKAARDGKQKLVYIGFGSVPVGDSRLLTQQIVDAVLKADVRCILAKGWSDRYDQQDPNALPIELPESIHQISSAPHDWLFKQVDAVVHHGGAGTTGASLRAGKPTIIRPFFGDQYFFATRVDDLGVGHHLDKVTTNALGKALWIATHDARMQAKAAALGESIRAENGVQTAINEIYRSLDYATTLIKTRDQKSAFADDGEEDSPSEDTEENWTFVEKDSDADPIGSMAMGSGAGVIAA